MPKICTVSLFRAPLRQTLMFVAYHLNIGVDHIIIFFDDPVDEAIVCLLGLPQVTCILCTAEYWRSHQIEDSRKLRGAQLQDVIATQGLAMARALGCDWILHLDSDELLYSANDKLKEHLFHCRCDVVRLDLHEALPQQRFYGEPFMPTVFRRQSPGRLVAIAKLARCQRAFFQGQYLRAHKASKVVVRTSADFEGLRGCLRKTMV